MRKVAAPVGAAVNKKANKVVKNALTIICSFSNPAGAECHEQPSRAQQFGS
jgi:hypothetical protein